MALHSAPDKLIFAPAGSQAHGQAEQFTLGRLHRSDLNPTSPIAQFNTWFSQAQKATTSTTTTAGEANQQALVAHPEACTLSTASLPSGRVTSARKARDLESNPHAALLFYWEALQRQVRVEGVATRLSREESQVYFDTRVRGSRIGAWASRQSQVLQPQGGEDDDGRSQLEGWVKEVEEKFQGKDDIPVPDFWGGLRIVPSVVEFWQGRESRLHDRFVYEREEGAEDAPWTLQRLSP
uniref:pyridoxal 5'-phosphate synthase n=1 Tax=Bionectria ochroleuca TaxID=29856 RepID=A0A8H7TP64_BIOOC